MTDECAFCGKKCICLLRQRARDTKDEKLKKWGEALVRLIRTNYGVKEQKNV